MRDPYADKDQSPQRNKMARGIEQSTPRQSCHGGTGRQSRRHSTAAYENGGPAQPIPPPR